MPTSTMGSDAVVSRIKTASGEVWLSSQGIVECCNHSKAQQTLKDAQENVAAAQRVAGGKKRPMLIDMSVAAPQTAECRAYYTSPASQSAVLAYGIVTPSTLSRVIANFLVGLTPHGVPMRLFGSREEAIIWLRQYLE